MGSATKLASVMSWNRRPGRKGRTRDREGAAAVWRPGAGRARLLLLVCVRRVVDDANLPRALGRRRRLRARYVWQLDAAARLPRAEPLPFALLLLHRLRLRLPPLRDLPLLELVLLLRRQTRQPAAALLLRRGA